MYAENIIVSYVTNILQVNSAKVKGIDVGHNR